MLRRFLSLNFSGSSTFLFFVSNDSKTHVRKRRWWRWPLRVFVLLLLALGGAALYLNQAGLPGFAKRSLQTRLAKRGWCVVTAAGRGRALYIYLVVRHAIQSLS